MHKSTTQAHTQTWLIQNPILYLCLPSVQRATQTFQPAGELGFLFLAETNRWCCANLQKKKSRRRFMERVQESLSLHQFFHLSQQSHTRSEILVNLMHSPHYIWFYSWHSCDLVCNLVFLLKICVKEENQWHKILSKTLLIGLGFGPVN